MKQIIRTLNNKPYSDEMKSSVEEYSDAAAYYVLAVDKDVAESTISERGTWIDNLGIDDIIRYVPRKELVLRLTDGSIYKEVIK